MNKENDGALMRGDSSKTAVRAKGIKLPGFVQRFLQRRKGMKLYEQQIGSFLKDSDLTVEESEKLVSIEKEFGLRPDEVKKIQSGALSTVFADMKSDKRITDDERKSLDRLFDHFHLTKNDIAYSQDDFNKYHTLALIDKGVLPHIKNQEAEINLIFKEDERLHWATRANLLKRKRVTTRINYGGITASVKIMKGVRYRVGSIQAQSVTKEIMDTEDSGILYITDQRIGYLGFRKQFSFPYKKIGSLELRPDGLHIFKDGKEAPYILGLDDYEVVLSMISFLINQESKSEINKK